jgi:DnaJ like chaperone protein
MAWLGKILGGTVGLAVAGPLGAVIGGVIGNQFDKNGAQGSTRTAYDQGQFKKESQKLNQQEEKQLLFFTSIFSMLAKFAQADGAVTRSEIEVVDQFIKSQLRLDGQSRQLAIKIFDQAKQSSYSFSDYAAQFYDNFKNEKALVLEMFDLLMKIAVADHQFHHKEAKYIDLASHIFELSQTQVNNIKDRYLNSKQNNNNSNSSRLAEYYRILECEPGADFSKVKKKYRQKAKEFHPDNVIRKGLPEEFVDFAEEEFKKINEAYEKIKAAEK